MKDVKRIIDIPYIENYLDKFFILSCYDTSDKIQVYYYKETEDLITTVEVYSSETLIEGGLELADILTQDNIDFFQITYKYLDAVGENDDLESYYYRPLINDKEKDFMSI